MSGLYFLEQGFCRELAKRIASQRAIAGDELAVPVHGTRDAFVDDLKTQGLEPFAELPGQVARHVADLGGLRIERVGEGTNLVALVDVAVANREEGRRAVAQGDDKPVVGRRPFQHRAHVAAVRYADQRAMSAGDEDSGVLAQALFNHRRQAQRLFEL